MERKQEDVDSNWSCHFHQIFYIGSTELAAYSLLFTVFLRFANGILVSPILRGLGQDPKLAKVAGHISLWLTPVMFSFIISFTCQMFLQAQSMNMIITYLAVFLLGLHILLSWLLTVKYKFRIPGAMASTILAYWVPNLGQLILEVWYNTVLILLIGHTQNAEVSIDALSICLNINGWEMMISLGFLAAASVRVSNELGRGNSNAAKFSIVMIVATSCILGFVLFVLFLFLRGKLAYIFTKSPQVADAVASLSPLFAFSILVNSIQPVLSRVTVGAGRQKTVAYVNIACYYLIGIPVGAVLGKNSFCTLQGVWFGMLFGTLTQTIALIIITCKTDWEKQVYVARNRINKWYVADSE
ncbi:hypothetical protein JCGZ_18845 [Jatropha curcas]|uniref:Protein DETOXIFICATION n=1 Tax=Jatropha curcas TaxID=180498 RepID=A0A067K3R4_JATCU|nr:hypothetical protein JCGZ_18845 [Jatropha curcas]